MDEKFYLCPKFFSFIETFSIVSFVLFGISTFFVSYSLQGKVLVMAAYGVLFVAITAVKLHRRKGNKKK